MNAETLGEVAGLLLVAVLVAVVAWLGRRQELRRAAARRAPVVPQALDAAVLPVPVDPWPHADEYEHVLLTALDITPAGVR